jgi:integrase
LRLGYEAVRGRFERYLSQAGLTDSDHSLHSLRHTFASELLNAGMRLECLQQLLGHSCIEMTRRYARLTDTTRREEYFRAMAQIEKEPMAIESSSLPSVVSAATAHRIRCVRTLRHFVL